MGLSTGTKLGPYEIIGKIGAGGMGEVFRARDSRLGRDVAIKILPSSFSSDTDRLRRFEQEARVTGGLNHPNILAVYDIGTIDGNPYLVSELLEGENLREHMGGSALSQRKATDYGKQIALGLAAAHEKGVVHRDLKPENIFVLRDGRIKILDFGLAKLVRAESMAASSMQTVADEPPVSPTSPGQVLGTVGYMAPEQVKGKMADHRSDIFAFGTVLYEMLSGQRAFKRDSSVETMSAILKEEPPELTETNRNISPGMERVVRHCLEKSPAQRFQSASDIAFDLETISGHSGSSGRLVAVKETKRRHWLLGGIAGLIALLAFLGGYYFAHRTATHVSPRFRQLTFQRGIIFAARFAPDGQSILYTAAWNGAPTGDMYTTRTDSIMSRGIGLNDTEVLSVSSKGGMAIRLRTRPTTIPLGMLAIVPITGGAPRELLDEVAHATWAPDGESLAVVHRANQEWRLEFPIGKVLVSSRTGSISDIRFSPDGKYIAYFDHPTAGDTRGYVAVTDLEGKFHRISQEWSDLTGLVWSPSGDEVWFTGSDSGINSKLYAARLDGSRRDLLHVPGRLRVLDVNSDGKVLITNEANRQEVYGRGPFSNKDVNLSWFDWTLARTISRDGQWAVLEEDGEGGGPNYSVFIRKMDGSEAIRLGTGSGNDISADDKWVISTSVQQPSATILLPTGAGQPQVLGDSKLTKSPGSLIFLPDGKAILAVGAEGDQRLRTYRIPLDGTAPSPIGPDGYRSVVVSPDGTRSIGRMANNAVMVDLTSGSVIKEFPGIKIDDRIMRWSDDGKSIFVGTPAGQSIRIQRMDVSTGGLTSMFTFAPPDLSGVIALGGARITPNGKYYLFGVARTLSDLYVVEGVK